MLLRTQQLKNSMVCQEFNSSNFHALHCGKYSVVYLRAEHCLVYPENDNHHYAT